MFGFSRHGWGKFLHHTPVDIMKIKYNRTMPQYNSIRFSIPNITYNNTRDFAEHLGCVSDTGNPKAARVVKQVFTTILKYYENERFQECLEEEGINALAYVEKCINKGMKESLKEDKDR